MEPYGISEYTSVIKRWRKPILPPLMTEEKKNEILEYRRLAEIAELRIKRRREERQFLKSKIRFLFEKFREMDTSSNTLIEDKHTKAIELFGETSSFSAIKYSHLNPFRGSSSNYFGVLSEDRPTGNENSDAISFRGGDVDKPPVVEFRIRPGGSVVTTSESSATEQTDLIALDVDRGNGILNQSYTSQTSSSDVHISFEADDGVQLHDYSVNVKLPTVGSSDVIPVIGESLSSDQNIQLNIVTSEIKLQETSDIPEFISFNKDTVECEINEPTIGNNELEPQSGAAVALDYELKDDELDLNASRASLRDNNERDDRSPIVNCEDEFCKEADFSPSSRVTVDDSETSFHTGTPSTDLEKYMNSSIDTLTSPSVPKSLDSVDCSLATEFSSKSEDVTVINLSSGTTTPQFSEEGTDQNSRNEPSILKDSLTVFPDINERSDCRGQRIRRNSYTLETPSPVLLRALEKNSIVGPTDNDFKASPCLKSKSSLKLNDQINSEITRSANFPDKVPHHVLHSEDEPVLTDVTNRMTGLKLAYKSAKQSNSLDLKQTCGNLKMGILQYSEQQIQILKEKHRELRNYLNQLNDRISPSHSTHSIDFIHSSTEVLSRDELVVPISAVRDVISEQEEHLEQLRQQLFEEHHRQMAALFEQQQLQWQKLAAFIQQEGHLSVPTIEVEMAPMESRNAEKSVVKGPSFLLLSPSDQQQTFENTFSLPLQASDPIMKPKFDRVSAAVKGYLTRRLMQSDKVQSVIQTIKDTVECALQLHTEFPQKEGCISEQDALLHRRLIVQLNAACHEFHHTFFSLSAKEKMALIAQTRNSSTDRSRKIFSTQSSPGSCISAATLKVLARKHGYRHSGRSSKVNSPACRSPLPSYRSRSCPPKRHSPFRSPSNSPLNGHNRTVSRKVKKMPSKPFRP